MFKLTSILCCCIPLYGFTQAPQISFAPKHYVCYRTPVPMQIDGLLNEIAWQHAVWTDTFVDIEGDLNEQAKTLKEKIQNEKEES